MFRRLKKWMFYKSFAVNSGDKKKPRIEINEINSICILFEGTDESERKLVHQFKKKLIGKSNKKVDSLAFIKNKLPVDNMDYAAFNLKNINWYGVPSGGKVNQFVNTPCDLLIVLCTKMLPHYEYIIAHSKAKFKIGPALTRAEKYLDLIVDAPLDRGTQVMVSDIIKAVETVAVK